MLEGASQTCKPNYPGTGSPVDLFSGSSCPAERTSTLGRAVNGGQYALLGAGVSHCRDHRRLFGLWRDCVRCGRHCKDTVFYLPDRLCRDAADGFNGPKKSTHLAPEISKDPWLEAGASHVEVERPRLLRPNCRCCGVRSRSTPPREETRRRPGHADRGSFDLMRRGTRTPEENAGRMIRFCIRLCVHPLRGFGLSR